MLSRSMEGDGGPERATARQTEEGVDFSPLLRTLVLQ